MDQFCLFYVLVHISLHELHIFRNTGSLCPVLGGHVEVQARPGAVGGITNLAAVSIAFYMHRLNVHGDVASLLVLLATHSAGPNFNTINIHLGQHGLYQPVQLRLIIISI